MLKLPASELPGIQRSRLVNRSPIFYGWIILLAGSLGLILTSPGQTYAVSIFIEHFITDLGLSRSLVSALYTAGTLVGSLALPLVGRQIDRYGARRMVVLIAALFGLACIYMGLVQNALMLGLGFIAIRMLGQGSLGLVSQNVINQWWVRRRGLVIGISGLLVSLLGVGGFPNLINVLIPLYGWRMTFTTLGLLLITVMAPLGYLLFRSPPEVYGLEPDGGQRSPASGKPAPVALTEENWTLGEARRTLAFWVVAVGLALMAMLSTGLFFHMISIFADNGLSATVAASIFLPTALTTAFVTLGSGVLIDQLPVRLLLAVALICLALSLWLAQMLHNVELAFLYSLVLGVAMGLLQTVNSVVWAAYFGRRHLGSITGVTATILVFGSALGPIPLGLARDLWGNYDLVLKVLATLPFLLGLGCLFVGRPHKQSREAGPSILDYKS
ncbi:MAG: MFS transporter [Anaerolineae bacterium]